MSQKRWSWTVTRQALTKPEGWSRWDHVYQALLTWTDQTHKEETSDENSSVRTCFELATSARSNDRTTTGPAPGFLPQPDRHCALDRDLAR